jgi:hypothetical protein
MSEYFKPLVDSVEPDYYLFDFTSEELMEIILKPDEWGDFDYQLAQKILEDRGRPVNPGHLKEFKNKRLQQLREPERTDFNSVVLGYVFVALFPPAGIFLGYMLAFSRKNLPDGSYAYSYSGTQRLHGKIILAISSVATAIMLTLAITNSIS